MSDTDLKDVRAALSLLEGIPSVTQLSFEAESRIAAAKKRLLAIEKRAEDESR